MGRNKSNDDLQREVLELTEELGRVPTFQEYNEKYHHKMQVITKFGSWNKLLESVGLEPRKKSYSQGEKCSVKGCNSEAKLKGMCTRHYHQLQRDKKIHRTIFDNNEIIEKEECVEITAYDRKNNKYKVLIDKESLKKIKECSIYINGKGYPRVAKKKKNLVEILFGKLEKKQKYIYINQNPLDCRKQNIIIVSKTKVQGIFPSTKTGKYKVTISDKGKQYYLGTFDTFQEAKIAKQFAEMILSGKTYTRD